MLEIRHRITGEVLCRVEADTLAGADLTRADLASADLTRANLAGADLTRANLTRANLAGADLTRANLTRANLAGADLAGASRDASDPPVAGYVVIEGKLAKACVQCGSHTNEIRRCGHCSDCVSTCERCQECSECGRCECSQCSDCGEACGSTCSRCDECEECCECAHCQNCGDACESTCACDSDEDHDYTHTGYCDSCCDSARREESGMCRRNATGATYPANHPRDRKGFNSRRMAGVEVEFFDADSGKPITEWAKSWGAAIHGDGSVNGGNGWEAVTAPAAGDLLMRQISHLAKSLERAEAECDDSCGVHVHVDARDLAWPDVARLVRLWERLEPAMYILAGQDRWDNEFCEPWRNAFANHFRANPTDTRAAILNCLYSNNTRDPHYNIANAKEHIAARFQSGREQQKKAGYRYHALNLAPWVARRTRARRRNGKITTTLKQDATVEFRLHEGTHDVTELQQWTRLCVRIVDYAASATDRDVEALPQSAMRALASIIAPECAPWIVEKLRNWRVSPHAGRVGRKFGYMPDVGYVAGRVAMDRPWRVVPAAREIPVIQWSARVVPSSGWQYVTLPGTGTEDR